MIEKIHKAKKSLGQNFLKSHSALIKIIEAGEINSTDTILEIGPGKGALTGKLLEVAGKVIAVEMDRELISLLQEKFAQEIAENKLVLVEDDILNFDISKIGKYKIVANIPYNITGAIFKKFLTTSVQPELMVLLVQKEVAERVVARDGKESVLSISVKAYGTPRIVTKVPARYFSPAPKVDSAVIKIDQISRANFEKTGVNEARFWEIVKAGFAHKRKVLKSNIKEVVTEEKLAGLGAKRAENIRLFEWLGLSA